MTQPQDEAGEADLNPQDGDVKTDPDALKPAFHGCVFCGEKNFDLIGLKRHLMNYCEEFSATPIIDFQARPSPNQTQQER